MLIQEISFNAGDSERSASAHISIDGKEYLLVGGRGSVTVVAGRVWINSRRSFGRTFWKAEELVSHYKRHGAELLRYANRLTRLA